MSWWERTYFYRGLRRLPLTPSEKVLYSFTWSVFHFFVAFVLQYSIGVYLLHVQVNATTLLLNLLLTLSYVATVSLGKYRSARGDWQTGNLLGTIAFYERQFAAARGMTLPQSDDLPDVPPDSASPPPRSTGS